MAPLASAIESGASNNSLHAAKRAKNDEFYTQLTDIEKELRHYRNHLRGKVIFCNCDDPEWSNFWKYFTLNFDHLGLAKVVATHYAPGEQSYKLEFTGNDQPLTRTPLLGDGDFRHEECVEILKSADIVVTNPPFSLFREYVAQLIEHGKQFLVIGSQNAITYKEIFKPIRQNKLWLGIAKPKEFKQPDGSMKLFGNVCWFTNLPHSKRAEALVLYRTLAGNESDYPRYENYDALEVSKVADIPADYLGVIGVPISFLDKYNPDQFEIVGTTESNDPDNSFRTRLYTSQECRDAYLKRFGRPGVYDLNASGVVSGVKVFKRILVKAVVKKN